MCSSAQQAARNVAPCYVQVHATGPPIPPGPPHCRVGEWGSKRQGALTIRKPHRVRVPARGGIQCHCLSGCTRYSQVAPAACRLPQRREQQLQQAATNSGSLPLLAIGRRSGVTGSQSAQRHTRQRPAVGGGGVGSAAAWPWPLRVIASKGVGGCHAGMVEALADHCDTLLPACALGQRVGRCSQAQGVCIYSIGQRGGKALPAGRSHGISMNCWQDDVRNFMKVERRDLKEYLRDHGMKKQASQACTQGMLR